MKEINILLNEVDSIVKKYDEIIRNTGGHFNIFEIAAIQTDEVKICRIIKELIDPKGSHYQGDIYLRLFLKHVLKMNDEIADADLNSAVVEREKHIAENRRIDIFINIPGKAKIPIEVKIYAGDQDSQCYDYFKYAVNSKMYYLTPFGHKPSDSSINGLSDDNIQMISFSKDIIFWLNECLKLPETIKLAPIREVLIQFIDVLNKITYQTEGKMEREIVNLIVDSKESFRNADLIANHIKHATEKVFDNYFRELDKKISKKYPEFIKGEGEFEMCGIYYLVRKIDDDRNLALSILCENSQYPWVGLSICDQNDIDIEFPKDLNKEDIITGNYCTYKEYFAWKYICDDISERPDIKNHNEAFYSLLEPTGLNEFVEKTMEDIDEICSSIKPEYKI